MWAWNDLLIWLVHFFEQGTYSLKDYFLTQAKTEQLPAELIQPEKVHIALWEEFRFPSDSSVNDSGCVATSSPIDPGQDVFI